jgi:hypothetical protein
MKRNIRCSPVILVLLTVKNYHAVKFHLDRLFENGLNRHSSVTGFDLCYCFPTKSVKVEKKTIISKYVTD